MRLIACISLALSALTWAPHRSPGTDIHLRGIWAECEGANATLSSRAKIEELFNRLQRGGVNTVFLQIYRGDKAWYPSRLADSGPYEQFRAVERGSPVRLAIDLAHRRGMEIHAWVNIFRVWGGRDALTIRRVGGEAITRDGRGRSLLDFPRASLPDSGYWLDPGDPAARRHLVAIVKEILDLYPDIDGIHLDYARYPFDEKGRVEFGYGRASVSGFKKAHGFDPATCPPGQRQLWDGWRRDQVTGFVREAKAVVAARKKKLSAAVIADLEKCQRVTFQDWPRWIREGLIDFAVPMNYGGQRKAVRERTQALLSVPGAREKVAIGLGAYKLIDSPEGLLAQIHDCRALGAWGVVLFSYDNMSKHPELFSLLGKRAFGTGK